MIVRIACVALCFSLLSACCNDEYRLDGTITVGLVALNGEPISSGQGLDTIRGPFQYIAQAGYEQLSELPVVRPAQLLMAFSCGETFERVLNRPAVRIYLDRSFTFDERPLPPQTDLVALLADVPDYDTDGRVYQTGADLRFGSSFLQRAQFPAGVYTFTFEGELEDGTPVTQSTPVYIDL